MLIVPELTQGADRQFQLLLNPSWYHQQPRNTVPDSNHIPGTEYILEDSATYQAGTYVRPSEYPADNETHRATNTEPIQSQHHAYIHRILDKWVSIAF